MAVECKGVNLDTRCHGANVELLVPQLTKRRRAHEACQNVQVFVPELTNCFATAEHRVYITIYPTLLTLLLPTVLVLCPRHHEPEVLNSFTL